VGIKDGRPCARVTLGGAPGEQLTRRPGPVRVAVAARFVVHCDVPGNGLNVPEGDGPGKRDGQLTRRASMYSIVRR
jgi:hypothetical protein